MPHSSTEWSKCGTLTASRVEGVGKNPVNENKKLSFFPLVMWRHQTKFPILTPGNEKRKELYFFSSANVAAIVAF